MASFGPAGGPVRLPLLGEYGSNAQVVKVAQLIIAAGDSGDSFSNATSTVAGNQHAYSGGRNGLATAASDSNTLVNFFGDSNPSDTVDTDAPLDLVDFGNLGDAGSGAGVVVKELMVVVETAFTANVEFQIGDTEDIDFFFQDTMGVVTSTSWGSSVAFIGSTSGDYQARISGGKYYTGAEGDSDEIALIDPGSEATDWLAGRLGVYLTYFIADNIVYG